MKRCLVFCVAVGALAFPAFAQAPIATTGELLHGWQARKVVRANAALNFRPDFRIERVRRVDASEVRVCWSEPGYLTAAEGRDHGCDVVSLRGREFWLFDDSVMGAGWKRWL